MHRDSQAEPEIPDVLWTPFLQEACFNLLNGTMTKPFSSRFWWECQQDFLFCFLLSETGKPTHWTTSSAFSPGRPSIIQTILSCKSFTPATQIGQPNLGPEKNRQLMGPLDKPHKLGSPIGAQLSALKKKYSRDIFVTFDYVQIPMYNFGWCFIMEFGMVLG